jgi:hypothetical protein
MNHFDFMAGMEPMMYVNNAFIASTSKHIISKNFLLFIAQNSKNFIDSWDPKMDKSDKDDLVVSQTGPLAFSGIINGIINNDHNDNHNVLPRTCIFPSKFIYSNYEIANNPLSWLSPVSLSGHFDERAYLS